MLAYTYDFLIALLFTVVIETAVLILLVKKVFKLHIELKNLLFAGGFASFATLPYVWYIIPILMYWSYSGGVAMSETAVFLIEGIFYSFILRIDIKKAILISFICNLISFLGGFLLWYIY